MFHVEQIKTKNIYDIVIIGGGHAGVEAAYIARQFDISVAILTLPEVPIASAPCNPAVGGVGKGQLVREIDVLGGLTGKATDLAAIQFRRLNQSKGYAVQSTRAQIDKEKYSEVMKTLLLESGVDIHYCKVEKVVKDTCNFSILTTLDNFHAKKIVVTTGTFLAGKLHLGPVVTLGGQMGRDQAAGLESIFEGVTKLPERFKTGTPARLKENSINFSVMEEQPSDDCARNFHIMSDPFERSIPQRSCYLTRTSVETMRIIRSNRERSPLFNGQIAGVGPRYCPSIEDKAFRYPDRNSHHVFVEPEGLNLETFYPNGLSTSLPKDVQLGFLRAVPGFENVEVTVYGYAVEYDVVDTTKLSAQLESQEVPGLYFAGQVNGTSGYEEAAGQGIVAGMNAALTIKGKDVVTFSRLDSYLGVMVEDLITNKRDEPYRLFTARCENRLIIREDNAVQRMAKYRKKLGLHSPLDAFIEGFLKECDDLSFICDSIRFYRTNMFHVEHFKKNGYGTLNSDLFLSDLIRRAKLDPIKALENETRLNGLKFSYDAIYSVAIEKKYEGYAKRAVIENRKIEKLATKKIHWEELVDSDQISFECRLRIKEIKPNTFGELKNILGIRPATLAYVVGNHLS